MPAVWAEFTEAHGVRGVLPASTVRYGFASIVIRAVVAGLGVGLIPHCFVREELSSAKLINPLGLDVRSANGYYLTRPSEVIQPRGLDTFCRWLTGQAARLESGR
jgi:DNA-binding transcriptional LysR family regulator